VWGHSEVTQGMDVQAPTTAASARFLFTLYESLVGLDENLQPTTDPNAHIPGLASDWEISDDRLTYTFTIRDGVTFHDGTTLTSADVKYSFDRIRLEPDDFTSALGSLFRTVDSIETPDDNTVVIEHSEMYQPFLRQIAMNENVIIPENAPENDDPPYPGTGPYKFASRQQGNRAVIEAHDDYWGEEGPYLDEIEERTVTDPDTRLTSVQTGDFDLINDIPLSQMDNILNDDSDDLNIHTWSPLSFSFMAMNGEEEPFDEKSFRQAMDYALNKQELIEGALFGHGTPTASPSFPQSEFRNNDLEPREQDLERAQSLINESSYDPGDYELTLKVTTNYPFHVEAATIIQQYLSQVGLTVEIQRMPFSDFLDEYFGMEYRLAVINWFAGWEPAYLYRGLWHSEGGYNKFGFAKEEFDELLIQSETAESREDAIPPLKEAQAILHEEVPQVMLWFRDGTIAAKNSVHNIDTIVANNNNDFTFQRVWKEQ
jgi:peptide/nickel transport system substrate-binding protein